MINPQNQRAAKIVELLEQTWTDRRPVTALDDAFPGGSSSSFPPEAWRAGPAPC